MAYHPLSEIAIRAHVDAGPCHRCDGPAEYVVPHPDDHLTLTDLKRGRAGADLAAVLTRSQRWCSRCRPRRGRPPHAADGRSGSQTASTVCATYLAGHRCVDCGSPAQTAVLDDPKLRFGAAARGDCQLGRLEALLETAVPYCLACRARESGRRGRAIQVGLDPVEVPTRSDERAVRLATIAKYDLSPERIMAAAEHSRSVNELVRAMGMAKGNSARTTVLARVGVVKAQHPAWQPPDFLR